jgi:predicted ATPase
VLGAWRDAVAGVGRTLIVEGEAGVGKTRLVERSTELVRERSGQVLEGASLPFLETVPYAPRTDPRPGYGERNTAGPTAAGRS